MPIHWEELRIAELLRELVALSGTTAEALEDRLRWQRGRLGELLENRRDIPLGDLCEVLAVLDLTPADFFGRLYGFGARSSELNKATAERLDRRFEESRRVVTEALARRGAWKSERSEG